jgi:hypothetical protein
VLLIKRSDLQLLFEHRPEPREVEFAEESHRPRMETLRRMYELWTSSERENRELIREIELGVANPRALESLEEIG